MTALAHAFEKQGVTRGLAEFRVALSKFINSGGTYAQARAEIDAAERMSGMGQHQDAARQPPFSQARQPVEDEQGRRMIAVTGHYRGAPPSSFNRGGDGREGYADFGRPSVSLPVREPTEAQRKASADMRKLVRTTILDTHRIRDGRAIGDVRYGEIETLRTANAMEASLFRQIQKKIGYADHDAKLRDLVSADELNAMKQRAAEVSDAM